MGVTKGLILAMAVSGLMPAVGAAATPAPAKVSREEAVRLDSLAAEVERLGKGGGGVLGVTVIHLESGRRVSVNGTERFPMASTLKIAVAGALLAKVDAGELSLDQMIDVPRDSYVVSSVISANLVHDGVSLSLANLIELMIVESDNTATDVLLRLLGGPPAATAWLRRQGVEDQRVDRDTLGHIRDYFGFPPGSYAEASREYAKSHPDFWAQGALPNPSYDEDPRDTSTPEAMALLLSRISQGEALSAGSTEFLLGVMRRCKTGLTRIRGLLPPGTVVADKTGTMGGSINAVGIVTLPNQKGRLIVAVYIKKSDLPKADRERAIAEISRAAFDYFMVN